MENKDLLPKSSFEQYQSAPKLPETQSVSPEKKITKDQNELVQEKPKESPKPIDTGIKKKFRLPHLSRTQPQLPQTRSEVTVKIEKVLEDGLGDAFGRLSPIAKEEFKLKGEQTALKIQELVKSTHVKAKKIFELILEWLKLLPGVNRFFLEQEAKIKTDRILIINDKNKHS